MTSVAIALTGRGLIRMRRLPSLLLPSIIMPVFFVVAFSGSFAAVVQIDGYGTDEAVNWMTAWALLQGAAFAGVGAGGIAATDLENGFFDRLRVAPIHPAGIIAGLLGYSLVRTVFPVTAVLVVAFGFLGADMPGGVLGFAMAYLAACGLTLTVALFAIGIVFTFKTVQSLAFVQIVLFSAMFLSVGQAPLVAIEGWLHDVAAVNPITRVIRMCRQGFLGDVTWSVTWPGLVALAGMIAATGSFALWRYRASRE